MPSLCSKSLKQNYNNLVVIWNVVELAQEWRGDKQLRQLEAMLIVMDKDAILVVGTGEVIAPDDDLIAIGSGGNYALSLWKSIEASCKPIIC